MRPADPIDGLMTQLPPPRVWPIQVSAARQEFQEALDVVGVTAELEQLKVMMDDS